MTRYRFYIGHVKRWSDLEKHLVSTFGGYTRYDTFGAWTPPDGPAVSEPGRVYEVLTSHDLPFARTVALVLRDLGHQDTVLLTSELITAEFI